MHTKLFNYCERGSDPAFWAEPLNAITNAAFLIAALVALFQWSAMPRASRRSIDLALIAVVAIIGIGSFLFHTFATRWAVIADVAPIAVFMLTYMGYSLRRYLGWPWWATILGLAGFFIALQQAGTVCSAGGPCFNGSVGYFPALAAMLLIGVLLMASAHPAGGSLVLAGLIFAVSLTARTVDMDLCPTTTLSTGAPIGTHFIWHILNGTLLYVLLRAAILHGDFEANVRRQKG